MNPNLIPHFKAKQSTITALGALAGTEALA